MSRPRRLSADQRAVEAAVNVVVLGPLFVGLAVVVTASELAERCPDPRLVALAARDHAASRISAWLAAPSSRRP